MSITSTDVTTLITTLSIRFDPRNSIANVETVVADPLIKSLIHATMMGPIFWYRPKHTDIVPDFRLGQFGYRLHDHIANDIWVDLQRLAFIIHCAANDHNPFINRSPVSIDIPYAALDEISLEMPAISLCLVYQGNPLHDLMESGERVIERAQVLKTIGFYFMNWMAEAIRRSIKKGTSSYWNFGAFWGMSKAEFMERARKGYNGGGGFDNLRDEVQNNQDRYDDTIAQLVKRDSDAAVIRLTDGVDHEIRVIDPNEPLIIMDISQGLEELNLNLDGFEGGD